MQKMIQLSFFPEENDDIYLIKQEMKQVKESCDKVRKSLFVRHNELSKMYLDIAERLERIEHALCRSHQKESLA